LKDGFWQGSAQVNYPNSEEFTRIIEMKHSTKQVCENSTIVREYPETVFGREPYYPVPAPDTDLAYAHYKVMADKRKDVTFVGRLATYRYYSMDQVVGASLSTFERLRRNLDESSNGGGNTSRDHKTE
jgi:UDP-galactopyranose mutase